MFVRQDPRPRLVTWRGRSTVELPPPPPGTRDLAIGPDGRVAILADDGIFVADGLTEAGWTAVPELLPPDDEVVTGLAWSLDGRLAWAAARELGVPPFTVVAGSPGGVPVRIEVDAGLDGSPAWLDRDRIAVPVIRDPLGGLAIVSLAGADRRFAPVPAGVLAVAPSRGLLALGDRSRPRVEIRRIDDLTAPGGPPLAAFEEPGAAVVDIALSTDGRWLAAAWVDGDGSLVAVGVYEDSGGWVERGRLGRAALGAGSDARVRLAWQP